VEKYGAGAFDEDTKAADLIQAYEARIAALERLVGRPALELKFLKGALRIAAEKRAHIRDRRPHGISVGRGCRPIGVARSTHYDAPRAEMDDTALVEAIAAICGEFEAYGWRRVRATPRRQDVAVNHKKIRRLTRLSHLASKHVVLSMPCGRAGGLGATPAGAVLGGCGWRGQAAAGAGGISWNTGGRARLK
jgi:HTH-like domain